MSTSRDRQFKGILPIKGLKLRTSIGTDFKVLRVMPYFIPKEKNRYVHSIQDGMLLSILLSGRQVPIIVVKGGFLVLMEIESYDIKIKDSIDIMKTLGITEPREALALYIV